MSLRRTIRRLAKPAVEFALPLAERLTGFRTARGDYLPTRLRILTGRYEAEELDLMRSFLRPGHVVLDVGANVGYPTRIFARGVGPTGRVLAFEPNPLIFPILERNLRRFAQVKTFNVGLSSAESKVPLFLAGKNFSVASLSESYPAKHLELMENASMNSVTARVVRGDDLLAANGVTKIDAVKIDVEGWELNALAGLEKTIAASPRLTIFSELNPAAQECAGHQPRELLDWFASHGFKVQYPEHNRLQTLRGEDTARFIEQTAAHSHTTLFATRS